MKYDIILKSKIDKPWFYNNALICRVTEISQLSQYNYSNYFTNS